MRFRADDHLLSMSVIRAEERVEVPEGVAPIEVASPAMGAEAIVAAEAAEHPQQYVFTVTDGGFAKKTVVEEYRLTNRGGLGVKAAKLNDERGGLVGGLVVTDTDEVLAIRASGQVTRSSVAEVRPAGRDTMGLTFARANGDPIVAIARNAEQDVAEVVGDEEPADEAALSSSTPDSDATPTESVTDGSDETQEPE
jgi:DNA gyrase subunit A